MREDLLNRTDPKCPVILDYKQTADMDSLYNTPCTVAVYVLGLVLDWVIAQGGIKGMPAVTSMISLSMVSFICSNAE